MATDRPSSAFIIKKSMRMSDSPRRSPLIMAASFSPAGSVHLDGDDGTDLESIQKQPEISHRTSDFFEIPSDDDLGTSLEDLDPGLDITQHDEPLNDTPGSVPRRQSNPRKAQMNHGSVELDYSEKLPATPSPAPHQDVYNDSPSTAFNESVDELLSTTQEDTSRIRKSLAQTARSPGAYQEQLSNPTSASVSKAGRVLGAHYLAHEITLHALMRDEDVIDRGLYSIATADGSGFRSSLVPSTLRVQEARDRARRETSVSQHSSKRVQVIPPPIQTSEPRHSLPINFLPTPYPFSDNPDRHKEAVPDLPPLHIKPVSQQRMLMVRVRRPDPKDPKQRSTTLAIPPTNNFSLARPSQQAQLSSHPTPSFFDDEDFFVLLRQSFAQLNGPLRHLSARPLRQILIVPSSQPKPDRTLPHSSPYPSSPSQVTSTIEERLARRFRKPHLGRAKYRFVRWAYQLAAPNAILAGGHDESGGAAGSGPDAVLDSERDRLRDQERAGDLSGLPGLDFVIDWSIWRISLALGLVVGSSVLAALLWVFLGTQTFEARSGQGGFRGAGDRVGSGMALGIAVLLLGITMFVGWLGVSWLVI